MRAPTTSSTSSTPPNKALQLTSLSVALGLPPALAAERQDVRPLDARVTAIRIQWLPKSRNPASIGDDSRSNGTAGTESIVSAVRAIANAVVDALAHLGVTNIDILITAPKVWAVLKEKSVAL